MTQKERRVFLINYLKNEEESFKGIVIPHDTEAQKHLLRALMNVRPPMPVSKDFTDIQDEYLQQENRQRGIVSLGDLSQEQPEIYLWQGDITRLSVDAIVNAANSAMLGCFVPCHGCIDNAIHTAAGVQLRHGMCPSSWQNRENQKNPPAGQKSQKAYNLPCQLRAAHRWSNRSMKPITQNRPWPAWQAVTAPVWNWRQTYRSEKHRFLLYLHRRISFSSRACRRNCNRRPLLHYQQHTSRQPPEGDF